MPFKFNPTTSQLDLVNASTLPAGSDTQIQFNDAGAFGGNSNFVFDKVKKSVGIGISSPTIGGLQVTTGSQFTTIPANTSSVGIIDSSTGWYGNGFLFSNIENNAFGMVFSGDIAYFGKVTNVSQVPYFVIDNFNRGVGVGYVGSTPFNGLVVKGRLGVGVSSPNAKLHVVGSEDQQQLIVMAYSAQTTNLQEWQNVSADILIKFDANGGAVFNEQGNDADFRVEGDTNASMLFVDASTDRVGIGTATPNSKLQVVGSFSAGYVAKTADYTLDVTDYTVDCTGSFTITLPTAVGITGRLYNVKNSGTGTITVATTSSQTIDGLTTQSVPAGSSMEVQSTNTNWIIL